MSVQIDYVRNLMLKTLNILLSKRLAHMHSD